METLPQLAILTCTFIGASSIVIAEPLVQAIPPLLLLGIRFATAAAILAIILPTRVFPLSSKSISSGVIAGLASGLGSSLVYMCLPHISAGKLTFLIALQVAIVPMISAALFKHELSRLEWLALVPAVLGLWLMSGDADGPFSAWELVALASGFAYAIFTIALSHLASTASVPSRTFVSCLVIALMGLTTSPLFESSATTRWSPHTVLALIYLVAIGTVARFLLQAWAQKTASPSFTALTFSAEPVFAIALSSVFLGERFSFNQSVGALLILSAVLLVNYKGLLPGAEMRRNA